MRALLEWILITSQVIDNLYILGSESTVSGRWGAERVAFTSEYWWHGASQYIILKLL